MGGGCFAPIAAYAELDGGLLRLRGLYVTEDETRMARGTRTGAPEEAEALGAALAMQLKQEAEEGT